MDAVMGNEKRLIDVNKVINSMQKCLDESQDKKHSVGCVAFESIIEGLKQEPTVDAVEVVRCRDCKRCYKHTTKRNRQKMWICMRNDLDVCVRPDDFCSYGERKDNCGTRLEDVKK